MLVNVMLPDSALHLFPGSPEPDAGAWEIFASLFESAGAIPCGKRHLTVL